MPGASGRSWKAQLDPGAATTRMVTNLRPFAHTWWLWLRVANRALLPHHDVTSTLLIARYSGLVPRPGRRNGNDGHRIAKLNQPENQRLILSGKPQKVQLRPVKFLADTGGGVVAGRLGGDGGVVTRWCQQRQSQGKGVLCTSKNLDQTLPVRLWAGLRSCLTRPPVHPPMGRVRSLRTALWWIRWINEHLCVAVRGVWVGFQLLE